LRLHPPATPAWTAGIGDPVVSSALNHLATSTPASITAWARAIGVSRSTLSARFADVVGEPPGAFLTRWRLDNAARLLRQTDLPVATVAHQVGYQSEFSFSRAFKRARSRSPLQFRKHHAAHQAPEIVGHLEAANDG
jgi:AraC-like DNA-binding protein